MRTTTPKWLSCMALSCLWLANGLAAQERVALVIGNSNYAGGQYLRNPGRDADSLAKALRDLEFEVTVVKDSNKRAMKSAVRTFADQLGPGRIGLFFYAGHGMQVNGVNYLIPVGADIQREFDAADECLDIGYVLEAMESVDNSYNVLVLDCCRDNRFKRSWTRNSDKGLAPIANIPDGTVIAFSTAPGQTAADGRNANSPYARNLVEVLKSRPVQGLELVHVFRRASQAVRLETKTQSPWLNMDASMDDYYLWQRKRVGPLAPDRLRPHELAGARAGQKQMVGGIPLIWCPPGKFSMGSPNYEPHRDTDEAQVEVQLTNGFWLGKYEVTQAQWEAVMGNRPFWFCKTSLGGYSVSSIKTDQFPAEFISWNDAREFCQRLTEQEHRAGRLPLDWEFALPSEAQWEYACRAGTKTPVSFGVSLAPEFADFNAVKAYNATGVQSVDMKPSSVGKFPANAWGFHDMHGNVNEWCRDRYSQQLPGGTDPLGNSGEKRCLRGGCWSSAGKSCRSANRASAGADIRTFEVGFRVALVHSKTQGVTRSISPAETNNRTPPVTPKSQINSVKMKLVRIAPGSFEMGSPADQLEAAASEQPRHRVQISRGFYLATTEVTQREWCAVMGQDNKPWKSQTYVKEGPDYPATYISYSDAVEFCRRLSRKEGKFYRLPTEAEWEYACRAGSDSTFSFGNDIDNIAIFGWCASDGDNSLDKLHAQRVAQRLPNAWGLFDMHGNVSEWCYDLYDSEYYQKSPRQDPHGPTRGEHRVSRGGGWADSPTDCRSSARGHGSPSVKNFLRGFRVALAE